MRLQDECRYTKHIYIGSQRIVSKIGDFDSYGSDPRRIQYAGSETDGLSVDYKQKYVQQLQVIKDNYATFAVPYNGEDNNDYVDGKGFCCNDGSLEAAQARAMARAAKNNFQEGDSYEKMQFYYHPDHLGSSSYITNLEGEVVQHIEYVPFGEVFVEERNNIWNTPYLFNAKEFDEETGLYYYGARYYDPRVNLWISVDPLAEKFSNVSGYVYSFNNPIIFIDPNGESPKASELIKQLGINLSPFAAGYIDGVVGASPLGIIQFTFDYTTDRDLRNEINEGVKILVNDPIGSIKTIVGEKIDAYEAVLNGNASAGQKYEVGEDLGNITGAALTGGGVKKFFEKLLNKNKYKNVVYEVPGSATKSGKPYIGRSNNFKRRMNENTDGRDRTKAKIIGHYDSKKPKAGPIAEQNAMNQRGGVQHLDNKRNEIRPSDWSKYKVKPIK